MGFRGFGGFGLAGFGFDGGCGFDRNGGIAGFAGFSTSTRLISGLGGPADVPLARPLPWALTAAVPTNANSTMTTSIRMARFSAFLSNFIPHSLRSSLEIPKFCFVANKAAIDIPESQDCEGFSDLFPWRTCYEIPARAGATQATHRRAWVSESIRPAIPQSQTVQRVRFDQERDSARVSGQLIWP